MNVLATSWLAANQIIRKKLENMTEEQIAGLSSVETKDPMIMLIVAVFLGTLGIHRFMLGDTGMGVLELLTGGLCGILWLIDLFTIVPKTQEYNYNQILPYIQ